MYGTRSPTFTNLGRPCLALALVPSRCPLITEGAERLERLLLLGDLTGCLVDVRVGESDLGAGSLSLEVVTLWYLFKLAALK